jgi:hypothetical protein
MLGGAQNLMLFVHSFMPLVLHALARLGWSRHPAQQEEQGFGDPDQLALDLDQ